MEDTKERKIKKYMIRKLTESECWKLMGFTDGDVQKCKDVGISKTQLYKEAGNSIVVNCIDLIFQHIYKSQYDPEYITYDEEFVSTHSDYVGLEDSSANFPQAATV